jgi:hypothetical protein
MRALATAHMKASTHVHHVRLRSASEHSSRDPARRYGLPFARYPCHACYLRSATSPSHGSASQVDSRRGCVRCWPPRRRTAIDARRLTHKVRLGFGARMLPHGKKYANGLPMAVMRSPLLPEGGSFEAGPTRARSGCTSRRRRIAARPAGSEQRSTVTFKAVPNVP